MFLTSQTVAACLLATASLAPQAHDSSSPTPSASLRIVSAPAPSASAPRSPAPSSPADDAQPNSADQAGSSARSPQNEPAAPKSAADQQAADRQAAETLASPGELHELPKIEGEPDFKVIIPPGRPVWIESLPVRVGPVHTTAVSSGPYARQQDAQHALDAELVVKTREYIVEHLGSDLAGQLVRCDLRQIKAELVKPENVYQEEIVVSIGPMHQQHALLEFGPEFRAELDRRWARVMGTSRLLQMGLLVGGVLGLLGTVFGYFRVDNATRGFYTGRLQAMAAVAILALLGAGLFFARLIPWL